MSVTSDLSNGFFDTVKDVCMRLGCEPIDLLSVMMSESGVKARPIILMVMQAGSSSLCRRSWLVWAGQVAPMHFAT